MIREAKEHAESDEKRRALVDSRNNARFIGIQHPKP